MNVPPDNFYKDSLENRISELKKQLSEKNAIIDFLTSQLITEPRDVTNNINSRLKYHNKITDNSKKTFHDDDPLKKREKK